MTIKVTKKQLQEMITAAVSNYMGNMGDTGMQPEAYIFLYRGIPPQSMLSAVGAIIDELDSSGIELPNEKEAMVTKIIQFIHSLVKQGIEHMG